jgi:hypothetical protein
MNLSNSPYPVEQVLPFTQGEWQDWTYAGLAVTDADLAVLEFVTWTQLLLEKLSELLTYSDSAAWRAWP